MQALVARDRADYYLWDEREEEAPVRIGPDEIDVDLPRALFGGLRRGPTEELLSRVAEDYAQLYHENAKLKTVMARLEREGAEHAALAGQVREPDDYAQLSDENAELKAAVARLERELAQQVALLQDQTRQSEALALEAALVAAVTPEPARSEVAPSERTSEKAELRAPLRTRREADELARVVLEAAQRAAREMRESARIECELMLKKAGSYARELERVNASKEADLEELDGVKREIADRMRTSLRAILPQLAAAGAP